MGKQSRQKNKQRRNNRKNAYNKESSPKSQSLSSSSKSSSPLIQKLLHGDIKVRHGALAGVASTIFSYESLSKHFSNKKSNKHSGSANADGKKNLVSQELLQVISQRIMDDDLPCASCAVGCMTNYVILHDGEEEKSIETMLTPILLSRIQRLFDGLGRIEATEEQQQMQQLQQQQQQQQAQQQISQEGATSEKKKAKKKTSFAPTTGKSTTALAFQEQMSLLSQCAQTLCIIVETFANPTSTSSTLLHHQSKEFGSMCVTLLEKCLSWMQSVRVLGGGVATTDGSSASVVSAESGDSGAMANSKSSISPFWQQLYQNENESHLIGDVLTYASRMMHASCDDNAQIVSALMESKSVAPTSSLQFPGSSLMTSTAVSVSTMDRIVECLEDTALPALARLHSAGILLACRNVLWNTSNSPSASPTMDVAAAKTMIENLDNILLQRVAPILNQYTLFSPDITTAFSQQIQETSSCLKKEELDAAMEKDVLKTQRKKGESARAIARRQKEMKDRKKAAEKLEREKNAANVEATNASSDDMQMDDNDGKKNTSSEDNQAKKEDFSTDAGERYEKTTTAWKNACLPLKLCIEVITNLCAVRKGSDDVPGEEMAEDWDPEEECDYDDAMADNMGSGSQEAVQHKDDMIFFTKVIQCGLPDHMLGVFGAILLFVMKSNDVPTEVMEDLSEILTKCSSCLGNIFCNMQSWKEQEADIVSTWKELCQSLKFMMECLQKNTSLNQEPSLDGISAICSCMVAMLRFRPVLIQKVNEEDLSLVLSCLSLESPSGSCDAMSDDDMMAEYNHQTIVEIQKDAIAMLGLLCSAPHPDAVNAKICDTFLNILLKIQQPSISASLVNEVFNTLMDMYSADEGDPGNHEAVFRSKNVLHAFQKSVPVFKRKIKGEQKASFVDVELWRETALNASRFIKYKSQ